MAKPGTAIHDLYYKECKKLEENKNLTVGFFPKGWNTAIQIVNKKLLNHWVYSQNLGEKIYRRIESMASEVPTKNQVVICPKTVICEHFDGYSHTAYSGFSIPSSIVPPLFIPNGFFEKDIKIRYGYENYFNGWININPLKEKYIFESKDGTDLKITLERLPFFWKEKISKVDVNKNVDLEKLEKAYNKEFERYKLPFMSNKDSGYRMHILKYKIRRKILDSVFAKPFYNIYKNNQILRNVYKKINNKLLYRNP